MINQCKCENMGTYFLSWSWHVRLSFRKINLGETSRLIFSSVRSTSSKNADYSPREENRFARFFEDLVLEIKVDLRSEILEIK